MSSGIARGSGTPCVGTGGCPPPSVMAWPSSSVESSPPLEAYQWVSLEMSAWAWSVEVVDVGGCHLTGASSAPGPADMVPTEGESPSWRLSVGRWGERGGAGRTARWISGSAAPPPEVGIFRGTSVSIAISTSIQMQLGSPEQSPLHTIFRRVPIGLISCSKWRQVRRPKGTPRASILRVVVCEGKAPSVG